MPKKNRREALQSLLSVFMLGSAAGTVAYIKRDELADYLPAPKRPDWKPWVMVVTTVHPDGVSRDQTMAINSTKVRSACSEKGLGFTRVHFSDDLNAKAPQFRDMREMVEGPYSMVVVDNNNRVRVYKVPSDVESMNKLIEGIA